MTKMEDIRMVMEVNFFGAIELTQLAIRPTRCLKMRKMAAMSMRLMFLKVRGL